VAGGGAGAAARWRSDAAPDHTPRRAGTVITTGGSLKRCGSWVTIALLAVSLSSAATTTTCRCRVAPNAPAFFRSAVSRRALLRGDQPSGYSTNV
jgi:hypothetical protein